MPLERAGREIGAKWRALRRALGEAIAGEAFVSVSVMAELQSELRDVGKELDAMRAQVQMDRARTRALDNEYERALAVLRELSAEMNRA